MKKKLKVILTVLMTIICSISVIGCGETQQEISEQKVMNLSLNPKVEFILDKDDKVVSVNALNEEGNVIIGAETFIGKTAEESATLFVQICNETGYIVSGNVEVGENKLQISFSGDAKNAEKLYNSVKAKVNEYFTAENITAQIEKASQITKEQLEKLVAECEPYFNEAKVKAMEYNELISTLVKSRAETAEFYSQELKKAYYESKAFAFEKAEMETIRFQAGLDELTASAFWYAFKIYEGLIDEIEESRATVLLKDHSPYQVLLKAFREAKVRYIKYRNYVANLEQSDVTEQILAQLETYKTAVETAETSLVAKAEELHKSFDEAKVELKGYYDSTIEIIEDYSNKTKELASEISAKQKEIYEDFFTTFEITYTTEIAKAKATWKSMRNELIIANQE